jgi:hypothetical protein
MGNKVAEYNGGMITISSQSRVEIATDYHLPVP